MVEYVYILTTNDDIIAANENDIKAGRGKSF